MQRKTQFALAAGVLLVGVLAALPFRASPSPPASTAAATPANPASRPVRHQAVALRVSAQTLPSPAVGLDEQSPAASPSGPTVAPTIRAENHLDGDGQVPQMPTVYRPLVDPLGIMAARHHGAGNVTADPRPATSRAEEETTTIRHRVSDGDTLFSLARKYLGRGDRYEEIFAANRQVLTRPDVLPLGAELVIPGAPLETQDE